MARQEAGGVETPQEDLAPGNPLRGGPAPPGAFALDPDPDGAVETIQTHISHLYLTPSRVYKLRKPVKLSFLDFSTRAARNADCERELRLNRRLAPDVYLGVAPVEETPTGWRVGSVRQDLAGGGEAAPEHCVVMRRLPEEANGQRRLEAGELAEPEIDAIADRIALFHDQVGLGCPAPFSPREWLAHVRAPVAACLAPLEEVQDPVLTPERLAALLRAADEWIERRESDFERRRVDGRAVDGHGDLQLQHFWLEPGAAAPFVIDCVEFDSALRRVDGASDLAFASMDLRYRGRPDLAERLLARYARERDDSHLYAVIEYYECYRAAVRARVAALAAHDARIGEAQRGAAEHSAAAHLALAESLVAPKPLHGSLLVVSGGIGSGKSRMAEALAARTGGVVVGSDRTRKHMAGLAAEDHSRRSDREELYSGELSDRVYAGLLERAEPILRSGRVAILDARFATRARREPVLRFARELSIDPWLIEMECPLEIVRERLAERARRGDDPSDAGPELLEWSESQREPSEEWPAEFRLRAHSERADCLERVPEEVAARLAPRIPGEPLHQEKRCTTSR